MQKWFRKAEQWRVLQQASGKFVPPLRHPHAHPIMPLRLVQGSQEPIWPLFTEYMYLTVEWELKHVADGHLNQFTYSSLKSLFSRLAWHLYLVLFFFFFYHFETSKYWVNT